MKFIHSADLHIDSPLKGLQLYEDAPADQLRRATRDAFENLVNLALDEKVDFVLVAGDLFDGEWKDMSTGLWTNRQLRRLQDANIPVVMLRGNHDADSEIRKRISWPENVKELSVRAPETWKDESIGAVVHGQGFAHRKCPDDIAAKYPAALAGQFNIGMLHTSLGGFAEHETYAPTSTTVLESKVYDYWALGHIHIRQEIAGEVPIHYSGNTQGRHARETGAKGCLLVTVTDGEFASAEFRPLDTVRWYRREIPLSEDDHLDDLYARVQQDLRDCHHESGDRLSAVRLIIQGPCAAHRELMHDGGRHNVFAEIRDMAAGFDDAVWIEKIRMETSLPVDRAAMRQGHDLIADLLNLVDEISEDEDQLFKLFQDKEISTLFAKASKELADAGIDADDPRQFRQWLKEAESLLVTKLSDGGE